MHTIIVNTDIAIDKNGLIIQPLELDKWYVSPAIIPMSILEFRRTNGPGFNMTTVKALLNLRVDLNSSERSEALSGCKEV